MRDLVYLMSLSNHPDDESAEDKEKRLSKVSKNIG